MNSQYLYDIFALIWLFVCWFGYARFARKKAKTEPCLASVLHAYRIEWMESMLTRDNRIADASLLTNLERNVSFLASTSIFVIAGLVTTLASTDKIHVMLSSLPFVKAGISPVQLQIKTLVLILVHVYAFFSFTWAMRQYGFCAVLQGAAPLHEDLSEQPGRCKHYAKYLAKVIDQAGHSYNDGLRAFYFSIALLSWVMSVWLFVVAVAVVVGILYVREFHSNTLKALMMAREFN